MLVYMSYLNLVTDVKEVYFVFKGLTKITVSEPNDFIFSGVRATPTFKMCFIFLFLSVLLKPHIWPYFMFTLMLCVGVHKDV